MNNIADRLQPHQVRNEPGVRVPSCYRVVDAPKVRPDVWIKDPMKSIVLKVRDRHASRLSSPSSCVPPYQLPDGCGWKLALVDVLR